MSSKPYLGKEGTQELIKKTKELVPSKTSQLTNDSNFETAEEVKKQFQNLEPYTGDEEDKPASGYQDGDNNNPTYYLTVENATYDVSDYNVAEKELRNQPSEPSYGDSLLLRKSYKPALGVSKIVDVDSEGNETTYTDAETLSTATADEVVSEINVHPNLNYDTDKKYFSAHRGDLGDINFSLSRTKNNLTVTEITAFDENNNIIGSTVYDSVLDLAPHYHKGDVINFFGYDSSNTNEVAATPVRLYTSSKNFWVYVGLPFTAGSDVTGVTVNTAKFRVCNASDTVLISSGDYASNCTATVIGDGLGGSRIQLYFQNMSFNRTSYAQGFLNWQCLIFTFT